jgi:Protein of unknown function (DUF1566)
LTRFLSLCTGLALALPLQALAGTQNCQGTPTLNEASFSFIGGGEQVFDRRTRLIWMRCIEDQEWTGTTCKAKDPQAVNPGPRMTYSQAKRFAASRSTASHAWRLPTQRELLSVREASCYNPSTSLRLFPTEPAWSSDGFYWTSTLEGNGVAVVSAIGTSDAWSATNADETAHVRLVRNAPKELK